MKRGTFFRLLAVLYAAAAAVWLLLAGICAVRVASCTPRQLSVREADCEALIEPVPGKHDWALYADGALITTDGDPSLCWTVDGTVTGLRLRLRSSLPIDGSELFYTTAPGQEISSDRRLTPQRCDAENGVYEFRFAQPTYVYRLRLDPIGMGGAFVQLQEILLNPPCRAADWLVPDAAQLLGLLAGPALAALAVREIALTFRTGGKRKK